MVEAHLFRAYQEQYLLLPKPITSRAPELFNGKGNFMRSLQLKRGEVEKYFLGEERRHRDTSTDEALKRTNAFKQLQKDRLRETYVRYKFSKPRENNETFEIKIPEYAFIYKYLKDREFPIFIKDRYGIFSIPPKYSLQNDRLNREKVEKIVNQKFEYMNKDRLFVVPIAQRDAKNFKAIDQTEENRQLFDAFKYVLKTEFKQRYPNPWLALTSFFRERLDTYEKVIALFNNLELPYYHSCGIFSVDCPDDDDDDVILPYKTPDDKEKITFRFIYALYKRFRFSCVENEETMYILKLHPPVLLLEDISGIDILKLQEDVKKEKLERDQEFIERYEELKRRPAAPLKLFDDDNDASTTQPIGANITVPKVASPLVGPHKSDTPDDHYDLRTYLHDLREKTASQALTTSSKISVSEMFKECELSIENKTQLRNLNYLVENDSHGGSTRKISLTCPRKKTVRKKK